MLIPIIPLFNTRLTLCMNHAAPTDLHTLSLHDALPISWPAGSRGELATKDRLVRVVTRTESEFRKEFKNGEWAAWLGHLNRNRVGGPLYAVVFVQIHQARLVFLQVGFTILTISGNNHPIPYLHFARRGAVHGNRAGTSLGQNDIGGQALAVIDVVNVDLLEFAQTSQCNQVAVNGAGAVVPKFRLGNPSHVQLAFEHG